MRRLLLYPLSTLLLCSCAGRGPQAEARLAPTRGNTASGVVSFAQAGDKVRITALVTGLTKGPHGFHIHEKGDCSAPDAASAGGHFNPFGKPHGDPARAAHHAGDLPMLVAGAEGQARFEALMDGLTLENGPASILGRSIIVHAQPDDFTTQPAGNSGARVCCGIIKAK